MNYKKYIKDFIISIFIFSLVGTSYAVWTGLIAENGDAMLVDKWNELVNKVLVLETSSTDLDTRTTALENTASTNDPSVLQTHIFSDYTRRSTVNGGYYYFGPTTAINSITPKKADSIIQININYFGESYSHNNTARLQYSIDGGAWTNFDLVGYGQQGTLKLGGYPDSDYNSTPHSISTQVAKKFNTTLPIAFRMYHFNGSTYMHNTSINSAYESGPSTLILKELNAANSTYTKR